MKLGIVEKSTDSPDMDKINLYTRRELKSEEVYAFPITLCDNEVDRDLERFSIPALHKLAELFLGKTGIFDHSPKAENQAARIYDTEVIPDPNVTTSAGEVYHRLTAMAYMLRTEKNTDLIAEIDGGIKKEVSVGCAVGEVLCSVCGRDLKKNPCKHKTGVNGAHRILENPTDAYEWSFVAVPAQRQAGVTKMSVDVDADALNEILAWWQKRAKDTPPQKSQKTFFNFKEEQK